MYTVEEKLNLVMRYIATDDQDEFLDIRRKIKDALAAGGTSEHTPTDASDVVADLLKEIGVPCNILGYSMLANAIELCLKDDDYLRSITKRLYPDAARIYNSTAIRVERCIRHAIERAFDRCDIDDIKRIFGNTIDVRSGKIVNSEFITACMLEVRRRLKAQSIEA